MPADRKHVTPPSDLRYQSQVTWSQEASGYYRRTIPHPGRPDPGRRP
jgi:hypothetical protein